MSTVLEITQLDNGDVVLRDADQEGEPLVRIRFSAEVMDMLGDDLLGAAEAMIDAATNFLEGEPSSYVDSYVDSFYGESAESVDDPHDEEREGATSAPDPVVH